MTANELRAGNYVKSDHINSARIKVDGRFIQSLQKYEIAGREDAIIGIPLTHELLLSCGFVVDGFGAHIISINPYDMGIKLLKFAGDYLYIVDGLSEKTPHKFDLVTVWNKDLMKEFYLHELQNLYFALTRTELTVKL